MRGPGKSFTLKKFFLFKKIINHWFILVPIFYPVFKNAYVYLHEYLYFPYSRKYFKWFMPLASGGIENTKQ